MNDVRRDGRMARPAGQGGRSNVTGEDDELVVVDVPEAQRYEARLEGRVVGFAEYRRVRGQVVFFHTEVDPAFEGRGIGNRLAAGALDDVRARSLVIRVKCPFIAGYLDRHPEYDDLRIRREDVTTA